MSMGRFLGTCVRPRWEQSTVLMVQEQGRGHLPVDEEICIPISLPGSPFPRPQNTRTPTNPSKNETATRMSTALIYEYNKLPRARRETSLFRCEHANLKTRRTLRLINQIKVWETRLKLSDRFSSRSAVVT